MNKDYFYYYFSQQQKDIMIKEPDFKEKYLEINGKKTEYTMLTSILLPDEKLLFEDMVYICKLNNNNFKKNLDN